MKWIENLKITEKYKIWFGIPLIIILLGIIASFLYGFNLGIDFTGGTSMQFYIGKEIKVDEAKSLLAPFGIEADILHVGNANEEILIRTNKDLSNQERMEIFNSFKEKYGLDDDSFRQAQQFGPSMGKEIRNKALISIMLASIGMLVYISFRFEFSFGLAAVLALIHDVLVVLSIYVILRIPINSSFIAAILTIVGYSINDTIVVFDRLRENLKYAKKASVNEIADSSIKQTFSRTINTSMTTLTVILSLYILGVESIKEFSLPITIGVITGTYSSIFIASSIWTLLKIKVEGKRI